MTIVRSVHSAIVLLILKEIAKIHQGETVDLKSSSIKHFSPKMLSSLRYVPITSVDVEQSFSAYKHILTNRRHNLTEVNMEYTIIFPISNTLYIFSF
jgi:hypothetical protein